MLRNALWADDGLRDAFIANNPAGLSADDLAMVASWQYRVAGGFFIFRYLKKHTIFLSGSDTPALAYGVIGLLESFEEMLGPYLPLYVQAVLLPFEERIIYDGLLLGSNVYFGSGIRSDLNRIYRQTQEREGIITSLLPDSSTDDPKKIRGQILAGNKKVLTAFQKELGRSGLSPKMVKEHSGTITVFAQDFLLAQNPPRRLLDITPTQLESYLEAQIGKVNLVSFKRFIQFLRDTGRIDYGEAQDMLDLLKSRSKSQ